MEKDYSENYQKLYNQHWWWRARERIILIELKRLNLKNNIQILDIGCGNGLLFPKLAKYGKITGIEPDKKIISNDNPYRKQIYHYPVGHKFYKQREFDLILALDVAEHIENDELFFQEVIKLLKKDGFLIITVPAFKSLWARHDEINKHFRRYRKDELVSLLRQRGKIIKIHYLFPSLFAIKFLIAKVNKLGTITAKQSIIINPFISKVIIKWILIENSIIEKFRMPFGTSLIALVQK